MSWDEFNAWWDSNGLMEENPYNKDTAAFWAWEGWVAGVRAEREAREKHYRLTSPNIADEHL